MEEAGFQKVPEDDSTTASRVSCLWELHWDKLHFKYGFVLSLTGLTLNPDETGFDFLFLKLFFLDLIFFYSCFHSVLSLKVQMDYSLLFSF